MKSLILKVFFSIGLILLVNTSAVAEPTAKIMVLDFQLQDLTDLPNAPEEIARVAYLSTIFKQKLSDNGVEIVPVNDKIKDEISKNSATYLFDHTDVAVEMAKDSGADYIIIGVAMKPTYLFVYPRLLLVDIKTKQKAFTTYVQLEGSWTEKNTTAHSGAMLAKKVSDQLREMTKY
ncbi:MAG: DUF2380 domain-containing protein [Methylotenera sp.]|uniref:DUF2380 domain-containing protein n=1 Tax=Methylotenera sp. TaxID=2051956 RepID=UPI00248724A9|nr:DUF2380 domain-containing protein [Methylotenera sp.]MDI1309268.1 DUF2380 domain-containing protein [Methylotenera sp.]